ncbi:hypothetical protein METBIDRAFT_76277 [Metschnikowia bicuspidata var. bicuspidata NRRL YB-4993]|uniref:Long chronological lifespan protein 2 n=1 Tax=Metschnikowia bicuspidata var. bicuspidata NRRL YB-4993 TaxID=869754 RepID=A0A1A0HGU8_9ASCO|nr:hypothetical protein METBIDRAFT_76277 [Metschnikowia bicuspidata var. bicuspidata NRRL YB-4993]OBA23221.1 hypothetical protein METBIDRAFT_76277 [Metschnikowia bicuspidata var. bicuspidata NRRL YB-4993]
MFNFFNNQQQGQQQEPQFDFEGRVLESLCNEYLCPDTLACVALPKECPCKFPSSQLRCVLPNQEYICISKPAGNLEGKYDDPALNWKVDAKDDNVRDCGWVKRAWLGAL